MTCKSRVMFCALVVLVVTVSCARVEAADAPPRQATVLVLLPGQPGLPTASLISVGIRSTLLGEWSVRVGIETELVDIDRSSLEAEERRLRELFAEKYRGQRFDLVITASSSPLRAALRLRDDLFPGTPLIACAVDERGLAGLTLPPGVTVLTVRFDMEGTLRAALALLPDTRNVALVGGAAPQDRFVHDLARKAIREAGRPLDIVDLTMLPIVDLTTRLETLPEHTVVLMSSYQMDATGRRLYGLEIVEPLLAVANRPAFNMFEQVLGRGIVGGSVLDFEAVGREAARLGLTVLRGEALSARTVKSEVVSVPRFDGRQLSRWHLDERRLPPGSEVLYRDPTLWQYRWYLAIAIMVVGIQAALITALVVERHQRRVTQARLAERLRFEALVSDIGASLMITPPSGLDQQLEDCLRLVVMFLGADLGALWRPSPTDGVFEVSHVWSAPGIELPSTPVDARRFVYVRSRLGSAGGAVSFARLDELPPDAAPERAAFAAAGVRSLAAMSMHVDERLLGVLVIATFHAERRWPADVMQQLRILAESFANPVIRARDAAALESSAALMSAVLEALPGETAVIDAKGIILQTNGAWAAAARRVPALAVGADYLRACYDRIGIPPGVAEKAAAGIAAVLHGEQPEFSIDYPTRRYGVDRWFEVRVRHVAHLGGGAAVTHLDVTRRRQDEAAAQRELIEIAHLDRVAALGTLTSSIVHELNQPLAAILTNAQAAARFLDATALDPEELRACLTDIISDNHRAAEVLRRTRQLLRKSVVAPVALAPNDLVANTIGLVANDAFLQGVSIEFTPAPELPVVHGDLVQTQQVILNLLTNAISAAARGASPRRIDVWTAEMPRPYVEIGVHDSGRGIPPSDLHHIFEPFFTTKTEGLGMGLAICQKIVEAHGWGIMAENDPRGGATFRLHVRTDTPSPAGRGDEDAARLPGR